MKRIPVNYHGNENYNDNCKDVFIKSNYNPVAVKRKINQKIYINPKQIQLYGNFDGCELNDNFFIPEHVSELYWKRVDQNPNHVILIIQKNEFGLPKRIQVSKTDTIESILNLVSFLSRTQILFSIFDENAIQLLPMQTVIQCNLIDNSVIKVWNSADLHVKLNICNILDKKTIIKREYTIYTNISDIKTELINQLSLTPPIILFSGLSYFDDARKLMDYFIQNNDMIYYFRLRRQDQIVLGRELKNRKFSKLYEGHITLINENLILNRYKKKDLKSKYFRYEITSLLILSNANINRFVTLISMYEDGNKFYIATEHLEKGSLKGLYQTQSISQVDIITYFIQICEAIDYMHSIKMIHRNIKCSSILLDEINGIKLCNFHKAKYLDNLTTQQFAEGVPGSIIEGDVWWTAPEVLNCEPYGSKADVWSLGAALIEILTRRNPHYPLNINGATKEIKENKIIKYERSLSPRLSRIIDKCIDPNPKSRLTASEVLEELKAV